MASPMPKSLIQKTPQEKARTLPRRFRPNTPLNNLRKALTLPATPNRQTLKRPESCLSIKQVLDTSDENVRVLVRVRPLTSEESVNDSTSIEVAPDKQTLFLRGCGDDSQFTFDHVFTEQVDQQTVFEIAASGLCASSMNGMNGTVFAYGQTGSGKTFTMQGPGDLIGYRDEQLGIIPRTFKQIFELAKHETEEKGASFLLKCSFLEIYNEQVYDLLDSQQSNRQLREHLRYGVYVEGLTEQVINSPEQAMEWLSLGAQNRHTGCTAMNRESSRSHSVFRISIQAKVKDDFGGVTSSQSVLNLVDLAGSERQRSAKTEGLTLKEASNINRSLSALGNVINALASVEQGQMRHIAYRDSKLTFLLRDSLGGNAKTVVIATISGNSGSLFETLSTLKFAQRTKFMKNKPIVNESISGNVDDLMGEIKKLRAQLVQERQHVKLLQNTPYVMPSPQKLPSVSDMVVASNGNSDTESLIMQRISAYEELLQLQLDRNAELESHTTELNERLQALEEAMEHKEKELRHKEYLVKLKDSLLKRKDPNASKKSIIYHKRRVSVTTESVYNEKEVNISSNGSGNVPDQDIQSMNACNASDQNFKDDPIFCAKLENCYSEIERLESRVAKFASENLQLRSAYQRAIQGLWSSDDMKTLDDQDLDPTQHQIIKTLSGTVTRMKQAEARANAMNQQLQLLLREKRYIQARFESVKKIKDIKNENIDFNETMPIRSLDFESNSESPKSWGKQETNWSTSQEISMNYTEKSQYFESESNELKEFHCHDSTNSTIDEICKNQTEDLNAEIVYLQNKVKELQKNSPKKITFSEDVISDDRAMHAEKDAKIEELCRMVDELQNENEKIHDEYQSRIQNLVLQLNIEKEEKRSSMARADELDHVLSNKEQELEKMEAETQYLLNVSDEDDGHYISEMHDIGETLANSDSPSKIPNSLRSQLLQLSTDNAKLQMEYEELQHQLNESLQTNKVSVGSIDELQTKLRDVTKERDHLIACNKKLYDQIERLDSKQETKEVFIQTEEFLLGEFNVEGLRVEDSRNEDDHSIKYEHVQYLENSTGVALIENSTETSTEGKELVEKRTSIQEKISSPVNHSCINLISKDEFVSPKNKSTTSITPAKRSHDQAIDASVAQLTVPKWKPKRRATRLSLVRFFDSSNTQGHVGNSSKSPTRKRSTSDCSASSETLITDKVQICDENSDTNVVSTIV